MQTLETSSTFGPDSSKFWYRLAFVSLWNSALGTSCPKLPVYFVSDIYDQGCGWVWFDNCIVKSYSLFSLFHFQAEVPERGFCTAAELDTVVVDLCEEEDVARWSLIPTKSLNKFGEVKCCIIFESETPISKSIGYFWKTLPSIPLWFG